MRSMLSKLHREIRQKSVRVSIRQWRICVYLMLESYMCMLNYLIESCISLVFYSTCI